jgi:hypothetical protein
MNPEFQRQLWLQFSPTRLAIVPALLLLTLLTTYFTAQSSVAMALTLVASSAFCISVVGIGTMAAGASVLDEVNDRTWDQQRMSAMQPWAMTWGKLLGASSYGWYGGALALLVAIPCALTTELSPHVFTIALVAILVGLSLQSLLMAIHLQQVKAGGGAIKRGGVLGLVLVLLWIVPAMQSRLGLGEVQWWGMNISTSAMALISSLLLSVCAVCAAWRLMAAVLAVRQMPWGLPSFALVVAMYVAGFVTEYRALIFGIAGMITCAVMTYGTLLAEPQQRTSWQKVMSRWHAGDLRSALLQLPSWPSTLLLALVFAVWNSMQSEYAVEAGDLLDAIASKPLMLVMLMARDCAIALFFWFAPKPRRAGLAFGLSLLVLYGLLPWMAQAIGGAMVLAWVQPLVGKGTATWVAAFVHLGVASAALIWRWRTSAPA